MIDDDNLDLIIQINTQMNSNLDVILNLQRNTLKSVKKIDYYVK